MNKFVRFLYILSLIIVPINCFNIPDLKSPANQMTSFYFSKTANSPLETDVVAVIEDVVIKAELPFGADTSNMVASFTSTGIAVLANDARQTSGTTPNDFSNPLVYTVLAADGTSRDYSVIITCSLPGINLDNKKEITQFTFEVAKNPGALAADVTAIIQETSITATVPYGTIMTALTASFTITGKNVYVNNIQQINGSSINDFTNSVIYAIVAEDGSRQEYSVTVSIATDVTPPVPGNSGTISITSNDSAYAILNWAKASDTEVDAQNIEYAVYRSKLNNIRTVSDAETNGLLMHKYTKDINTVALNGVISAGIYYFNVIVKDASGNKSIYQSSSVTLWSSYGFNGNVLQIATSGDVLFAGGEFNQIGKIVPYGRILDSTSGTTPTGIQEAKINNSIYVSIPDGNGGWFIGGYFTKINDVTRNFIARISADGSLDTNWNPGANGLVKTILLVGTTLYVGGDFTSICGTARSKIAALDAASGNIIVAWNPGDINGSVNSITSNGAALYIGGSFTSVNGQTRNRIAALNATGTGQLTTWNPSANNTIETLTINENILYCGGSFTSIGGQTRGRIAAFDTVSGDILPSWNPDADNIVNCITVNATTIYAAGNFQNIGGQARTYIAALSVNGSGLATAWNPVISQPVYTIAYNANRVYIGGAFTIINGQRIPKLAVLDAASGELISWNTGAGFNSNPVRTIAINSSSVYVGGDFISLGGQNRLGIAALGTTNGVLSSWNPDQFPNRTESCTINAITVNGNTIYAGGYFNYIGGQPRNNIAALDFATGTATTWNPNANNGVFALTVNGDTVYAGGNFTAIGGASRIRIAALDTVTAIATNWNPNANAIVRAIAIKDNIAYIGGLFTNINSQTRNYIAAIETTGTGSLTTWNPNATAPLYGIWSIVLNGNTLYAGGDFTSIGGYVRNNIAALGLDGSGSATVWDPNANGMVFALAVSNNIVYAGGYFTNIGYQDRKYFAMLETSGYGNALPLNVNAGYYVRSFAVSDSKIFLGGTFTTMGGQTCNYFAALDAYGNVIW